MSSTLNGGATTHPVSRIFRLELLSVSFSDARRMLLHTVFDADRKPTVVVTPNVAHIVRLHREPALLATYRTADYMFTDGMPIVVAARLLRQPVKGRVTGADLFVAMCADLARAKARAFILGGHPGEEQLISHKLSTKYPGLVARAYCPSMTFDWQGSEAENAIRDISQFKPDAVFVCLGFPKQEYFAIKRRSEFPPTLVLCVGAALDFVLEREIRAPYFFRKSGFEWLWRLMTNPRRLWRRYLFDAPAFASLFFRELFANRTAREQDS
jgi:N-acetylglucosaminyldiphosphoundecaprenol N-acetyl-beta-D-mannosaminyltransferase